MRFCLRNHTILMKLISLYNDRRYVNLIDKKKHSSIVFCRGKGRGERDFRAPGYALTSENIWKILATGKESIMMLPVICYPRLTTTLVFKQSKVLLTIPI